MADLQVLVDAKKALEKCNTDHSFDLDGGNIQIGCTIDNVAKFSTGKENLIQAVHENVKDAATLVTINEFTAAVIKFGEVPSVQAYATFVQPTKGNNAEYIQEFCKGNAAALLKMAGNLNVSKPDFDLNNVKVDRKVGLKTVRLAEFLFELDKAAKAKLKEQQPLPAAPSGMPAEKAAASTPAAPGVVTQPVRSLGGQPAAGVAPSAKPNVEPSPATTQELDKAKAALDGNLKSLFASLGVAPQANLEANVKSFLALNRDNSALEQLLKSTKSERDAGDIMVKLTVASASHSLDNPKAVNVLNDLAKEVSTFVTEVKKEVAADKKLQAEIDRKVEDAVNKIMPKSGSRAEAALRIVSWGTNGSERKELLGAIVDPKTHLATDEKVKNFLTAVFKDAIGDGKTYDYRKYIAFPKEEGKSRFESASTYIDKLVEKANNVTFQERKEIAQNSDFQKALSLQEGVGQIYKTKDGHLEYHPNTGKPRRFGDSDREALAVAVEEPGFFSKLFGAKGKKLNVVTSSDGSDLLFAEKTVKNQPVVIKQELKTRGAADPKESRPEAPKPAATVTPAIVDERKNKDMVNATKATDKPQAVLDIPAIGLLRQDSKRAEVISLVAKLNQSNLKISKDQETLTIKDASGDELLGRGIVNFKDLASKDDRKRGAAYIQLLEVLKKVNQQIEQ